MRASGESEARYLFFLRRPERTWLLTHMGPLDRERESLGAEANQDRGQRRRAGPVENSPFAAIRRKSLRDTRKNHNAESVNSRRCALTRGSAAIPQNKLAPRARPSSNTLRASAFPQMLTAKPVADFESLSVPSSSVTGYETDSFQLTLQSIWAVNREPLFPAPKLFNEPVNRRAQVRGVSS